MTLYAQSRPSVAHHPPHEGLHLRPSIVRLRVLQVRTGHAAHFSERAHPVEGRRISLDVVIDLQMETDALDVGRRPPSSIIQERRHGAHTVKEERVLVVKYGVGFPSDLLVGA